MKKTKLTPRNVPSFVITDERGNTIHPGEHGAPLRPGDVVYIQARVLEVGQGGGYERPLASSSSPVPKTSSLVLDATSLELVDWAPPLREPGEAGT